MDGSSVSDGLHVGLDADQPDCSEQHCRKRIGKDAGRHKLHTQVTHTSYTHKLHTQVTHTSYTHKLHTQVTHTSYTHKLHTQVTLLNFQTSLLVNNKEFYFLSFVNYNWSSQMFVGHSKYK